MTRIIRQTSSLPACLFSRCSHIAQCRFITADTVVLTQPQGSTLRGDQELDVKQELLEKPADKADNLRMLLDLNGNVCEVVTGVTVG
jgi:predicted house-cleaning NTP pyrophosphatase (Maf/HAM1 superfamily)